MSMFTLRRSQKQSGFTLMELLIVIAVLGLLLGMLIPRLAGITDDTVDTVCDTNNKGTRYLTQMYINKYNTWPDGLTNLVDMSNEDGQDYTAEVDGGSSSGGTDAANGSLTSGSYTVSETQAYMPSFQHDDQEEAQVLAAEFWTRNVPGAYTLSSDEATELNDMGITTVYHLTGENRTMEKDSLGSGTVVMMMGMNNDGFTFEADYPVGNPEWIGRIMMAVNDKCDLVKKGILQASALCPGAVLAEEDFTHKEYILVLPRLESTVAAFTAADTDGVEDTSNAGILNGVEDLSFEFIDADDTENGRILDFEFEAQASWEFDMSCPEGHKWPDNDEDSWVVYTEDGASDGFTAGDIYTY